MTDPFRASGRPAHSDSSSPTAFLAEERESFTQAFAYDHFQWPAFKVFGMARPTVMELRTPAQRAAEERGLEGQDLDIGDQDGGDAAGPYTTTNSAIPVYQTGVVVPVDPDAAITPQTNASGPVVGIDDFRADDRFDHIDGSGYAVVIIDGGIDLDDPFFGPDANGNGVADRIVYQYDFADNDGNASDVDGHGSNVASIAASSDATYTGMAPGADIIALKVFSDSGSGHFGYVEQSLQWVINNATAYNIVSVNMSLGDSGNYNAAISLYGIGDELATLASMGVIVVSASGNDFYELNSVQGVAYPSADPNSLSVGAVYDGNTGGWQYLQPDGSVGAIAYTTDADHITPFSQRDDQLTDIMAPGADIIGAGAGSGLVSMHGTSQAAPHITGIVALAQQLAVEVLGRKLTYQEFSDLLSASADIIIDGDDEDDNVANSGLAFPRVNVAKLGEAILDMAEPNGFSIAALSATKAEGNAGSTAFTFTVTRSGYAGEAASVDYSVSGGSAGATDFTGNLLPAGTIAFAAGETSKTLTVLVKGDTLPEADESFIVTLSNPSGDGTIESGSAGGVIVNDDVAAPGSFLAIAALDAVKLEGDSGTTAFTFTVTRSGSTGETVTVNYGVSGGAVNGADFAGGSLPSGTLTFAAGETSKTVTLLVQGDGTPESDETFTVSLSNPSSNASITAPAASGIIANDDAAGGGNSVALLQADFDTTNDFEGFGYRDGLFGGMPFQRYASGDWEDQALRVLLGGINNTIGRDMSGGWERAFVVGEAGAVELSFLYRLSIGADYEPSEYSRLLVSIDGGTPILVDQLTGDGNDGPVQTTGFQSVTLALGSLAAGSHTLRIGAYNNQKTWVNEQTELLIDNVVVTGPGEPPPPLPSSFSIAADDAAKAEGDAGETLFTFIVTRGGDTSLAASVDYAVTGAVDGSDFAGGTLPAGTLVFLTGETQKALTIAVAGDTTLEGDEGFTVTLSKASTGSEVATASAAGTILNDDAAGPATFLAIAADDAVKAEGDAGSIAFTFTVTRSGDTSAAGTVDYAVTGAVDGSDFAGGSLPSGTVNFAAGETSKTLTVEVAGDTAVEPDEGFTVTLSNASGGAEITTASAAGMVLNDDVAPAILAITANDHAQHEGDAGSTPYSFTVTRSNNMDVAATVDYGVIAGDAESDDFVGGVLPSGTLSFAAGESSKTFTVSVAGDTVFEPAEYFVLGLSNPSAGATVSTAGASSTILNDDPAPPSTILAIFAESNFKDEGDSGATLFTYRVQRSGDTTGSGSVDYSVAGNTNSFAVGDDFVGGILPSGTLTFAAGETEKLFAIEVQGDTEYEGPEGFLVTLSNPTGGMEIAPAAASAVGTILNDDAPGPNSFSIAARYTSRAEGDDGENTPFPFEITRTSDTAEAGSVYFEVTSSQVDGSDFSNGVLHSGWINFPAGENFNVVTLGIWVVGDNVAEADETFTVTLSNPSAGFEITTASASATILNDDGAQAAHFAIAAEDAVKAEGDAGATDYVFTVTRSGDTSAAGSVDWTVSGGDPDAADFGGSLPGGTVSFAAGETAKAITVQVSGDTDFEADEDFTVTLSNPSAGASITTGSAQGTVLNDDPAPPATFLAIAAEDAVKAEGDAGSTAFTFTVTRSGDTSAAGTVDYAVTGTADGSDFAGGLLPSGSIGFAAGETSKTVTIEVAGDTAFEADESFTVTLSNPSAGSDITTASAQGTIVNDDPAPPATFLAIAADDAAKAEGDAGSTAFTFTVTRSGDTSGAGTVDYAVTGTADGSDFAGGLLPSGSIGFAAGETSKTVTIEVAGDTAFEADESFTVTLSDASAGSAITTASAQGTILNDDPAPPATFLAIAADDAAKAEGDSGTTSFTFTVTRSGDTSGAGTVDYTVTGTADGGDFAGGLLPSGSVGFAAGETSKTITVNVAGDTAFEADEAFTVTLSNASAGSAITTASAQGTIVNDDPAPPATFLVIAADDAVKDEGLINETFLTFTVTRSGDTSVAGTVDYAVSGAVDGADFVGGLLPSGTLSFAAGEVSKVLSFNVAGDGDEEPDEAFTVTLSNASAGSAITTASANGTIVNDDGPPEPPVESFLSIEAVDAVKSEGDDGTTLFTFIVSRPGTIIGDASVDYTVTGSGDNPADADDFVGGVLPSGTVTIQGEGASSVAIVIEVAADSGIEPDEGFTVTLSNPSAGAAIVTASAEGIILNDDVDSDPGGSVVILSADFDSGTEGFVYSDGVFVPLPFQTYASGSWEDQALTLDLGGVNTRIGRDIAGAWETDFVLAEEMEVTLSFDYEMLISADYDAGEFSRLLVSIDGGTPILVEELLAGGTLSASDTVELQLGSLAAGTHSLAIGGYNNQKTWSNEFTEISIDDVLVTGTPAAGGATALAGGGFALGSGVQPLAALADQDTGLLATV